ncbi:Uncharacterised protein [Vibrio cholerae]|nr:Uncharacterised protein [Vibrio cholerae]
MASKLVRCCSPVLILMTVSVSLMRVTPSMR